MKIILTVWFLGFISGTLLSCTAEVPKTLDLSEAIMLVSPQIKAPIQETARTILAEEIEKRTGLPLGLSTNWDAKTLIALALATDTSLFGRAVPSREDTDTPERIKEG